MEVIGNPSTDVPRHAAVVEAGLINKKKVSRVTVHFYAAVPVHARIRMYQFIRTESCYYTDTDSALTKRPPPPESQGSSALGKRKLESRINSESFFSGTRRLHNCGGLYYNEA